MVVTTFINIIINIQSSINIEDPKEYIFQENITRNMHAASCNVSIQNNFVVSELISVMLW
jgi:hypothetical protein